MTKLSFSKNSFLSTTKFQILVSNDIQYLLPIMLVVMISKTVADRFNIALYVCKNAAVCENELMLKTQSFLFCIGCTFGVEIGAVCRERAADGARTSAGARHYELAGRLVARDRASCTHFIIARLYTT
jgi:hypothetical protein